MTPARRRSMVTGLVVGALLTAAAVVFLVSRRSDGVDSVDLNAAEINRLPATALLTLDGAVTNLRSFTGTPLVINFWQQACAPCRKEMPAFEQVHRELGDKVRFIGVNGGDEEKVARDFAEEVGVTYEILRDPRYDTATKMGVKLYPATILVSADGTHLEAHYGEVSAAQLRQLIAKDLLS